MILVTFIPIHFVIICDVLLWRTYGTYPALSLKSGCDKKAVGLVGKTITSTLLFILEPYTY
jgi:hypothetical protein